MLPITMNRYIVFTLIAMCYLSPKSSVADTSYRNEQVKAYTQKIKLPTSQASSKLQDFKLDQQQQVKYKSKIQLPAIDALPQELSKSLSSIKQRINSTEFTQEKAKYSKKLAKDYNIKLVDKESKQQLNSNTSLVLFISSSMPALTISRYARDLAKVGGIMVMRGGVGGITKIAPTMKFIHNSLKQDPSCTGFKECQLFATQIIIDPKLFTANNIQRVPALAYLPKLTLDTYCQDKSKVHNIASSNIIYGDASLSALLDELIKLDEQDTLKDLKKRLADA